jgi:hypothetical protein
MTLINLPNITRRNAADAIGATSLGARGGVVASVAGRPASSFAINLVACMAGGTYDCRRRQWREGTYGPGMIHEAEAGP